jgi:pyridoxamine 5'-phosphate oxidase
MLKDHPEFKKYALEEKHLKPLPHEMFSEWYEEAAAKEVVPANMMTLATATDNARPSARIVLLKDYGEKGYLFYTNYESRKGKEISINPAGALLFFWYHLERQVRIEGRIEKISKENSDTYFKSRPFESQLGAIISPQSKVIPNREYLTDKFQELKKEKHGGEIERPEFWGGYMLIPDRYEFWQGREFRLHDRIEYQYKNGHWLIRRIAP